MKNGNKFRKYAGGGADSHTSEPARIKNLSPDRLRRFTSTGKGTFLCGAVLGCILFILLYGVKILDVTYDGWLLAGGDLTQHYIGWMSYRSTPWYFPLCMTDGLSYPYFRSIIYTDSIPHFANIFKLLSPLLPETFQYFGIFGIFSYAMMGGFSTLLIRHFAGRLSLSLILSTLFIYSPYVLQRMYSHTSLASQWIIVAGLYLWLCRPSDKTYKLALCWAVLGFAAAGIHIYFIPMLVILCLGFSAEEIFAWIGGKSDGRPTLIRAAVRPLACFLALLIGCVLPLLLYGAFYGTTQLEAGGLGHFTSNLNTMFNPLGNSLLLGDLPLATDGQYEGYGYLGLGGIILLLANFFVFAAVVSENEGVFAKPRMAALAAAFIAFALLAVSISKVTIGSRVLFETELPGFVSTFLGSFRASGRFIWGACYIVFIVCIVRTFRPEYGRIFKPRGMAALLVAVQLVDLSPRLAAIHYDDRYQNFVEYTPSLDMPPMEALAASGKKKFIFQPYYLFSYDGGGREIAIFAMKHDTKISNFYFARLAEEEENQFNQEIETELLSGYARKDAIYIFGADDAGISRFPLYYYEWGGFVIGLSEEHPELESDYGLKAVGDVPHINATFYRPEG